MPTSTMRFHQEQYREMKKQRNAALFFAVFFLLMFITQNIFLLATN